MRNTTISRSFVFAVANIVVSRVVLAGMDVRTFLRDRSSRPSMGYWQEHCQIEIACGWDLSGRHPLGNLKAGFKSRFLSLFGQSPLLPALVLCPVPTAAAARATRPSAYRPSAYRPS